MPSLTLELKPKGRKVVPPEAFRIFDSDGDGRISSLESAGNRSFSVMDSDRDEFIAVEEYVKRLRATSR